MSNKCDLNYSAYLKAVLVFMILTFGCQVYAQLTKHNLGLDRIFSPLHGNGKTGVVSPLLCGDGDVIYKPLPAFDAPTFLGTKADGTLGEQPWPPGPEARNKLLPNISTQVSLQKLDASASVGLFSVGTHRELVTIDFMKYRSEPLTRDLKGTAIAYGRIGVGMRLKIDLNSTEGAFG